MYILAKIRIQIESSKTDKLLTFFNHSCVPRTAMVKNNNMRPKTGKARFLTKGYKPLKMELEKRK